MSRVVIAIAALFIIAGALFFMGKPANHTPAPDPAVVVAEAPQAETAPTTEAGTETSETVATEEAPAAETAPEAVAETPAAQEGTETAEGMAEPETTAEATEAPTPGTAAADSLIAKPASLMIDVPTLMQDRVLGKPDAPVTIIEYASMTCPHCAHFAKDVLPQVKEKLINTGKARLVFREFPLDQFALKAAMMARCTAPEKYFDLLEVIFSNQERWTKAEDPVKALKQLGALTGMDDELMDTCMNSAEMESIILTRQQQAQTGFGVKSTPTFVFNNGMEMFSGGTYEKFEATVNTLSR